MKCLIEVSMRVLRTIIAGSIVIHSFSVLNVQAAIYKCVSDEKGIYYIDKPCPVVDIETKLNAVKDPKNGYVPSGFKKDEEPEVVDKGIVVGRDSSDSKGPSKAADDRSENGNFLLQSKNKGGGGSIVDPANQNGNDIVSENSPNQKLDTSLIGNVGPNGNEPLNVDELVLRQGGPKD